MERMKATVIRKTRTGGSDVANDDYYLIQGTFCETFDFNKTKLFILAFSRCDECQKTVHTW